MAAISAAKPISAVYLQTQLKNFDKQILEKKYNKLFQVDTMDAPSADLAGVVYQYIGGTTADYTFGYFYTCKEDPAGSGTYKWEAVTQDAPEYTIVRNTPAADSDYVATYTLQKDGEDVGDVINIPKDFFVTDAFVGVVTDADLATDGKLEGKAGFAVGDTYLQLDVNIAGKDSTKSVFVNVSKLVDTYTAGDAIAIDTANKNAISVSLATDSGLKITDIDKKLALDFETENITFTYSTWETPTV